MIVMFGASSDIGRRASAHLLDAGCAMRLVAHQTDGLDARAETFKGDAADSAAATRDADVVISCAHARYTAQILDGLGTAPPRLVLVGSAWRYSSVYEKRGQEVVAAEAAFMASGRRGVMLHPTMIYGGHQENNLRRLLGVIRRLPVLPMPGGGRNLVQPIHVEDVALCIVAAAMKDWQGPHAFAISGPTPMRWRDMAASCAAAMGHRRLMLPLPLSPVIAALQLIQRMGRKPPLDPNVLLRFREDVDFSPQDMQTQLGVTPRDFATGLSQMLREEA